MIAEYGFRQRIHTNGILFSQPAYDALKAKRAIVFVSVDSGTEDVFRRVKGHGRYSDVWDNIEKYVSCSPEAVYIKYNIMNYNSDESEIDAFLMQCESRKVRNVVVSAEISSYCTDSNAGPFYFTEKEFNASHYLYNRANEKGFNVLVAKFAFQVRGEYDDNGALTLPSNYYDNIDHDSIRRGIMIEAFPTVDAFLRVCTDDDIVIFCGGGWGTLAYKSLNKVGKTCILVDSEDKEGETLENSPVSSVSSFVSSCSTDKTYNIIVAGKNVVDIVRIVNNSDINAKLYWLAGSAYKKYIGKQ